MNFVLFLTFNNHPQSNVFKMDSNWGTSFLSCSLSMFPVSLCCHVNMKAKRLEKKALKKSSTRSTDLTRLTFNTATKHYRCSVLVTLKKLRMYLLQELSWTYSIYSHTVKAIVSIQRSPNTIKLLPQLSSTHVVMVTISKISFDMNLCLSFTTMLVDNIKDIYFLGHSLWLWKVSWPINPISKSPNLWIKK